MAQHEITGVKYCVQILSAIFIYYLYFPIVCIKERTSTGLSVYFLESQTVLESLTNVFCVMMLEQFQFCPKPSLSKDVMSGRRVKTR